MASLEERLAEATRWADEVSARLTYPVEDVNQLMDALDEDDDNEVEFAGERYKVGKIRKRFPKAFFPVESREDLIARIGHLEMRAVRGGKPAKGEKRDRPPDDAGDPPDMEMQPRKGGFPGVRGHGKRTKPW